MSSLSKSSRWYGDASICGWGYVLQHLPDRVVSGLSLNVEIVGVKMRFYSDRTYSVDEQPHRLSTATLSKNSYVRSCPATSA